MESLPRRLHVAEKQTVPSPAHRMAIHLNRRAVLSASAWTILGFGAAQALRLVSSLILTRLLVPEAFALSAFAMVILVAINLMSDVGLRESLIRHPDASQPTFQDTVFTMQVARGTLIFAVCLCVAGAFALAQHWSITAGDSTYAHPLLPLMVALIGCVSLVDGLLPTKFALAARGLQIRAITLVELATQIGSLVFTALIAYLMRSPVALVLASVAASLIRLALVHLLIEGRGNRFAWDRTSMQKVMSFGRWIVLSSAIGFIAGNIDKFVLAGIAATDELGMYALATTLYGVCAALFTKLFGSVVFPLFSQSLDQGHAVLFGRYRKAQRYVDAALLASCCLTYVSARAIVGHLYDARYAEVGTYLAIMSLGFIGSRNEAIVKLSTALGDSSILAKTSLYKAVLFPALLLALYPLYGMKGAALSFVLVGFSDWPIFLRYRHKKGLPITLHEWALILVCLSMVAGIWIGPLHRP